LSIYHQKDRDLKIFKIQTLPIQISKDIFEKLYKRIQGEE